MEDKWKQAGTEGHTELVIEDVSSVVLERDRVITVKYEANRIEWHIAFNKEGPGMMWVRMPACSDLESRKPSDLSSTYIELPSLGLCSSLLSLTMSHDTLVGDSHVW